MTDVRLTATNPEDSSVVPVACNEKGELKLEEPISFNGNLDGNLNVTGSANITGAVTLDGSVEVGDYDTEGIKIFSNNGSYGIYINGDGDADSAFSVRNTDTSEYLCSIKRSGFITSKSVIKSTRFGGSVELAGSEIGAVTIGGSGADNKALIGYDGSAQFGGNPALGAAKAGFTAEGYLWCTTRRGDTVILDATSNGLATWADYTPPTRRDLIKEKVDEWSEKDTNDPDFGVSPEDNTET